MPQLPNPISRQDKLLHNIADGTPSISDMDPQSREEEYLKYIAMNGSGGISELESRVTALENTVGTLNDDLEGVLSGGE